MQKKRNVGVFAMELRFIDIDPPKWYMNSSKGLKHIVIGLVKYIYYNRTRVWSDSYVRHKGHRRVW